ncbi:MAG: hypothetical protein U5O16_36795 [Rhodococcus sp. (in: high G+C Gram-positive bacteria)]|uniref:thioesterase domain-containing protein n=1 Tax=Rhodococcus sp. TaxID=1831 RepID=UPI002AD6DC32|nr:hypothetical protein [Rhodococcus sp. (in: high G+C Gram-positive bacteria)]
MAVIAHAVAVQLRGLGETVSTLAMMDSFVLSRTTHLVERTVTAGEVLGGLGIDSAHDSDVAELSVDSAMALLRTMPAPFDALSRERVQGIVDGIERSSAMLQAHEPEWFDGELLYFASVVDDPTGVAGASTWAEFVDGKSTVTQVHSTHWQMASASALAEIGPVLDEWVSR